MMQCGKSFLVYNSQAAVAYFLLCIDYCCGQLWVRRMICGQTCDEQYHFTFYLIVLGYL